MNECRSCSIAVGNQILQFKLCLLSNLNYEGKVITTGLMHPMQDGANQVSFVQSDSEGG